MLTAQQIQDQLPDFTGTEVWHCYSPNLFPKVLLTDGAKFIADACDAYWLMDAISSYAPVLLSLATFAVVRLEVKDGKGVLTLADDDPATNVLARQEIHFTNFPLAQIKFFFIWDGEHWTLLLPSEY